MEAHISFTINPYFLMSQGDIPFSDLQAKKSVYESERDSESEPNIF